MRTLSSEFRGKLELVNNDDPFVIFATIYYRTQEPIRVNTDICDYWYDGHTFIGAALSISLLTDNDRPPTATITLPNVDRRITQAILALTDAPYLKLEILLKSDFNDDKPRRPIVGAPTAEIVALMLRLRNAKFNASAIQATIGSFDVDREPWPKYRCVPSLAPALYR